VNHDQVPIASYFFNSLLKASSRTGRRLFYALRAHEEATNSNIGSGRSGAFCPQNTCRKG